MVTFRKIKRFTGTKKKATFDVYLQFHDSSWMKRGDWVDVLDITSLPRNGVEVIYFESLADDKKYRQALEYEEKHSIR